MAGRIATAIEQRLTMVLEVAEQALEATGPTSPDNDPHPTREVSTITRNQNRKASTGTGHPCVVYVLTRLMLDVLVPADGFRCSG